VNDAIAKTEIMLCVKKDKVEPFQFEPSYPPGEEPDCELEPPEESPEQSERLNNTEWCTCAECVASPTENECFCCQELDLLNDKFNETGTLYFGVSNPSFEAFLILRFINSSGVNCITEHPKFIVVCLDTDVLATALIAIHNARCNPVPDPIQNK